jgi:phage FluMu protein Com
MAFQLKCTHCGATLKTGSKIAPGKKVKCPKCAKLFTVEPDEDEEAVTETEEFAPPQNDSTDEDEAPKTKKSAKVRDEEEDEDEKPKSKRPAKARDDEDEEDEDEKPKSKRSAKARDDDDEDDDAPKKKGKDRSDDDKPKKKTGMIVGIVLGVLLLCCCLPTGGAGWFFWSAISKFLGFVDAVQTNIKKMEDKRKTKDGAKAIDTKPAFTRTALAMTQEFLDNEKNATAKYQDRLVEVTGEIWDVTPNKGFTLKGAKKDAKDALGISLVCDVRPSELNKVAGLANGNNVRVVGKVTRVIGIAVQLSDCTLTELAPKEKVKPPPVKLQKVHIIIDSRYAKTAISRFEIFGPPGLKQYQGAYQLQEVAVVQGSPPPNGPCYLLSYIARGGGGDISSGGDTTRGTFFTAQLPPRSTLTNLKTIGTFQAKMIGVGSSGLRIEYTLVEATLQSP